MKKKICVVGGGLAGLYFVNKLKDKLFVEEFNSIELTMLIIILVIFLKRVKELLLIGKSLSTI